MLFSRPAVLRGGEQWTAAPNERPRAWHEHMVIAGVSPATGAVYWHRDLSLRGAGAALWWGSRWWTQLRATTFSDPWLLGLCGLMLLVGAVLLAELVAAGTAQREAAHAAGARDGRGRRLLSAAVGAAAVTALVAAGGVAARQSWRLEPEHLDQRLTAETTYPAPDPLGGSAEAVWAREYPERLVALLSADAGPIVVTELRVEALDGRTGEVRWTYTRGDVPGAMGRAALVDDEVRLGCGTTLDAVTGTVLARHRDLRVPRDPVPRYEGEVDLFGPHPVLRLREVDGSGEEPGTWEVGLDSGPYLGRPVVPSVTVRPAAGVPLAVAVALRNGASQPVEYDAGHTVVYGVR
ncbi:MULTISPECIES: hypothetical protein [unclassified Actinomyces]|uniref:hypothetical protein n=1 Tax=unclassified Actinomyces TaxID=2609248 RepID=UPI002017894A|nr:MULTISPECIES: hypothetical protein [unclassified Actinomyces]MCL3777294.1 hypothetical protein [Actinomyces sp. AC-20-1]MCL3789573.1 hypothetical protein [Actinomyces sp. 187325]MCL3791858.1 hypothetical protein [Actinomyces sp. 186855]MCL3793656.1 hypothetical protein [Actinomyces sp. 217892]